MTSAVGSGRLVDALFAPGTTEAIAARITALLEAGSDHRAVQVVSGSAGALPLCEWRQLAGILPLICAQQPGHQTP
jgi:hypothetical protein